MTYLSFQKKIGFVSLVVLSTLYSSYELRAEGDEKEDQDRSKNVSANLTSQDPNNTEVSNTQNKEKVDFNSSVQKIIKQANVGDVSSQKQAHDALLSSQKFCMKAAKKGNPKALYVISQMKSALGQWEEAEDLLLKAAEKKHLKSQLTLASVYDSGEKKDPIKATKWYKAAADQGDKLAIQRVVKLYSKDRTICDLGWWMNIEKINQDPKVQRILGKIYEIGSGVSQNYEEAAKWYEKAVTQNHRKATFKLGVMYLENRGTWQKFQSTQKRFERSVDLFTKAYNQGHKAATAHLAWRYRLGQGVAINTARALVLYDEAVQRGYKHAMIAYNSLSDELQGLKEAENARKIAEIKAEEEIKKKYEENRERNKNIN